MNINEDKIKDEYGSIENFLKSFKFSRNTYEALKKKKGKSFAVNSQSFKLKELLKEQNYL